MTKTDLICQCILAIAEIVSDLRKKSKEYQEAWKKDYLENIKDSDPSVQNFMRKALDVIESYL